MIRLLAGSEDTVGSQPSWPFSWHTMVRSSIIASTLRKKRIGVFVFFVTKTSQSFYSTCTITVYQCFVGALTHNLQPVNVGDKGSWIASMTEDTTLNHLVNIVKMQVHLNGSGGISFNTPNRDTYRAKDDAADGLVVHRAAD